MQEPHVCYRCKLKGLLDKMQVLVGFLGAGVTGNKLSFLKCWELLHHHGFKSQRRTEARLHVSLREGRGRVAWKAVSSVFMVMLHSSILPAAGLLSLRRRLVS